MQRENVGRRRLDRPAFAAIGSSEQVLIRSNPAPAGPIEKHGSQPSRFRTLLLGPVLAAILGRQDRTEPDRPAVLRVSEIDVVERPLGGFGVHLLPSLTAVVGS